MTRFKILGAAAMLSMIAATPLFAQAAIQEPGAYAFYHPNGAVTATGIDASDTPEIGIGGDLVGRTPATPPGMRVRTGRFEKLRS